MSDTPPTQSPLSYIALAWVIIAGVGLAMLLLYCVNNDSGHSSLDPMVTLWPSAIMFGAALVLLLVLPCNAYLARLLWAGVVNGAFGALVGPFLIYTDIMREYGAWQEAGMPAPPEHRLIYLGVFATLWLVALGWALWPRRKRAGGNKA